MTHPTEKEKEAYRTLAEAKDDSLDSNTPWAFRKIGKELTDYVNKSEQGWQELMDYLKSEQDFDRVYFEGTFFQFDYRGKGKRGMEIFNDLYSGTGEYMKECLRYLVKRAVLERTEHKIFHRFFSDDLFLGRFVGTPREMITVNNIRRTLQHGEKGILLFGARHRDGLVRKLSNTRIHLEIFGEDLREDFSPPESRDSSLTL